MYTIGFNLREGIEVLAWAQTEIQHKFRADGFTELTPCGVILVKIHKRDDIYEYATAWYRMGDREWSHGNYFAFLPGAERDFVERMKGNGWALPDKEDLYPEEK